MTKSKYWLYGTLVIVIIVIIFISGCVQQETTCNKPYILVGNSCCLDQNDNNICDKDDHLIESPSGTPQLMECLMYNKIWDDWSGIGSLCESTQQCLNFIKSIDSSFDESKQQIKCGTTSFKKIKKDNVFLSCNSKDDCLSQVGLETTPGLSSEELKMINSIKQVIRCEDNFCEMTEGYLKGQFESSMFCKSNDDGTHTCTYCRGSNNCKTITE